MEALFGRERPTLLFQIRQAGVRMSKPRGTWQDQAQMWIEDKFGSSALLVKNDELICSGMID